LCIRQYPQLAFENHEQIFILVAIQCLGIFGFTAPSVRLLDIVLMLPIVSVVILTSLLERSGKLRIGVLIALFLVVNLNIVWAIWENHQPLTEISIQSFRPVKIVRLIKRTTLSGLEVFSPKKDDQCWD
jgi:uncharacterized membrane protein YhhN